MPMTKDPDGSLTAFVFTNADNAIEFGNTHLQHNADEWITTTHDNQSLEIWLRNAEQEEGITHVAVDPNSDSPRVLPVSILLSLLNSAP